MSHFHLNLSVLGGSLSCFHDASIRYAYKFHCGRKANQPSLQPSHPLFHWYEVCRRLWSSIRNRKIYSLTCERPSCSCFLNLAFDASWIDMSWFTFSNNSSYCFRKVYFSNLNFCQNVAKPTCYFHIPNFLRMWWRNCVYFIADRYGLY
mgnify:CR=1 FL=1